MPLKSGLLFTYTSLGNQAVSRMHGCNHSIPFSTQVEGQYDYLPHQTRQDMKGLRSPPVNSTKTNIIS